MHRIFFNETPHDTSTALEYIWKKVSLIFRYLFVNFICRDWAQNVSIRYHHHLGSECDLSSGTKNINWMILAEHDRLYMTRELNFRSQTHSSLV